MARPVQPTTTQQIYTVALSSAAGAYGAYLFTIVNPVGGAIYGAAYAITSIIAGKALDRPSVERVIDNTSEGKTLKWAIAAFAGLAVAWAAMAAAGFPITFVATLGLALATIPATFIIGCIVCCLNLPNQVRAMNERQQRIQAEHREQMDNIARNFQAAFEGQGHVLGST